MIPFDQPHAYHRAAERYGYAITEVEHGRLCAKLSFQPSDPTADCVLLYTHHDGREAWAVWHKGEWMAVVYEPTAGILVTFLPREAIRKHRDKLPW